MFLVGISESSEYRAQLRHNFVGVLPIVVRLPDSPHTFRDSPCVGRSNELQVSHAQHVQGEQITMYPIVNDIWTNLVCWESVVVVLHIFKAHILRKAKKR